MGCHTIFQGVFQTQGSNPHFLPLPAPALQEDSLPLSHCCPLIAPQSHFPTVLFSLLLLSTLLAHIFFFLQKYSCLIAFINIPIVPLRCSAKRSFVPKLSKLLSLLSRNGTAPGPSLSCLARRHFLPREAVSLPSGEAPV